MEIIVSHTNLDLDGLASMLAAKKLYPDAKLVLSGNVNKNARELISLYQNYLDIYKSKEINMKHIKRIIIVDTVSPDKLGKFGKIYEENIEIIVFDHHKISETNPFLKKGTVHHKNYGSNTAFLLEKVLEKYPDIKFESYEVTIYMMGIYEDTGSLSFSGTTPYDIRMAAYLLEKGANLRIVNEYVNKSLEEKQLEIFLELLKKGEIIKFSVDSVFMALYHSDDFIQGADVIVNKIKDIEGVTGTFVICGNKERSYIIGRSSTINIRVDEILREFGGGGHINAGAASVKDTDIKDIYIKLKEKIISSIKINKTAKDIMQKPVKTVDKETKIKEAYKIMIRFGYGGIPVTENEKLIGMLNRRDVDRAMMHGFGNAPARAYMISDIFTLTEDVVMEDIKKIMIENDIGRIAITDKEKNITGIVTRTDILRNIYELRKRSMKKEIIFEENVKNTLKNNFDEFIIQVLKYIEEISKKRKEKAYLVGGIVRDMILNIKNLDIDIVVEGNGMEFAKELGDLLKAKKVVIHEKFKTGVVILENDFKIDIATSRIEYYEYPTSLPTVEEGNIKQDLYRRDFTMNAMAVEIDYSNFGKLIDYFKGYEDLQNKKIRVLHSLSFVEDPTRIIRGIRFAVRYGFEIEKDTEKYIIDAVENNFLEKLTWKRVKEEFKIILSEKNSKRAVYKLFEYGVLKAINKNIKFTEKLKRDIENIDKYYDVIEKMNIEKWLIYFLILLEELTSDELEKVFKKFVFSEKFIQKYTFGKIKREEMSRELLKSNLNSEIYKILKDISNEIILLMLITEDNIKIIENIKKYITIIKNQENIIRGKDLQEIGYKKGPIFKQMLDYAYCIQLDENIKNKNEILQKILNEK